MDYSKLVKDMIEYVEENLYKDFDQSCIIEDLPLSEYHIHQLFQSIIGYSFCEYIEKRRISDQMYRWAATSKEFSIREVAIRCGFKKSRIFLRKLKYHYNISPNQYYKSFNGYKLFPNFNLYKYLNNPTRSKKRIETNIIELDSFTLYGKSTTIKHEEYVTNVEKAKFSVISNSKFNSSLIYTCFIGSKETLKNTEILFIPKGKYICFEGISDSWFYEQATRYVYSTYLINESFEISNYGIDIIQENDFEYTYNKYHKVKVYIPIKSDLG